MHPQNELYDFSPVGYVAVDTDLRIDELNRIAALMIGQTLEPLCGHPLAAFLTLVSVTRLREMSQEAAASGRATACPLHIVGSERS